MASKKLPTNRPASIFPIYVYEEGYPSQEVITYDGETTEEEMEEYFDGYYVVN